SGSAWLSAAWLLRSLCGALASSGSGRARHHDHRGDEGGAPDEPLRPRGELHRFLRLARGDVEPVLALPHAELVPLRLLFLRHGALPSVRKRRPGGPGRLVVTPDRPYGSVA